MSKPIGRARCLVWLLVPAAAAAWFAGGGVSAGDDASAREQGRSVTVRLGDVVRVPEAAVRCMVGLEGGARNFTCRHVPRPRYSVVYYRDNLFVFRNGFSDDPVFSARGKP
jgi:hypothetical protein